MTENIKFVTEPPPRGGNRRDWEAVAAALKANPGEWARFEDQPLSVSVILRQGVKALPLDEFEMLTRDTNKAERTCTVYLRYNPKERDAS